jgi:4'-phosphopantetheinyl transferase
MAWPCALLDVYGSSVVDLENMNRTASFLELTKRFFAPIEYEYVREAPPHLQRKTFFRIWTLKEAYIKAQGKGLSIPLDSFHFRLLPGSPAQAAIASSGQSDPGQWSFFEFQTALIYRVAVAVRNTGHGEYQVKHHAGATLFTGL